MRPFLWKVDWVKSARWLGVARNYVPDTRNRVPLIPDTTARNLIQWNDQCLKFKIEPLTLTCQAAEVCNGSFELIADVLVEWSRPQVSLYQPCLGSNFTGAAWSYSVLFTGLLVYISGTVGSIWLQWRDRYYYIITIRNNGSISPRWHHTACGQWGGRAKSNHGLCSELIKRCAVKLPHRIMVSIDSIQRVIVTHWSRRWVESKLPNFSVWCSSKRRKRTWNLQIRFQKDKSGAADGLLFIHWEIEELV